VSRPRCSLAGFGRDGWCFDKENVMIHILVQATIQDLQRFVALFATRGAELRGKHGGHRSQVFTVTGGGHGVVLLLEWESRPAFEKFVNDPAVQEYMQTLGLQGRPDYTFLAKLAEFPA
jgi:quinol monooxygenase YgiN